MSRKIDAQLDKLERNSGLTPDGRAWLIAACDPFHDTDITLAGYPDLNTSASIVQLIKKQIQITVPAGVVGNWDASVALFPTMAAVEYGDLNTVLATGFVQARTATSTFNAGGCTINTAAQGLPLWPDNNDEQIEVSTQSLDVREFIKGNARIIAMGFEVVNTTAEINKQGQATVWRMPTVPTLTTLYTAQATTPAYVASTPGVINRFPPGTLADAQLLFGSRSWAAAEGCYVTARQSDVENPFVRGDYFPDYYTPSDLDITGGFVYSPATVGTQGQKPLDLHAPYDISGVHFTGLSNQTSLTINVRWFIERSPGPSETDLVVLATPSSPYDPLALELYCQCMAHMPPGVMLKENPLGEWFRKALAGVEKWAPKIGEALGTFVPAASGIGNALGKGAGIVNKFTTKKKQPLPGSASTTQQQK